MDSPSLSALGAGVYPVTVTSQDGCALELVATVTEYSFPAFSLLIEDVSCFGQNDGAITIVSGQAGLRFGLNAPPTDTSHQFGMLESGTHILYIEDSIGCIFEEPITLQEPQPLSISLPEEIEAALGDSVLLSAGSALPSGSTFAWQPPDGLSCTDCSAPLAAPGENTVYQLIVTSVEGCRAEAEVLVLIDRTTKVYIPNAFSPNEDGRNDTFRPYAKGNWAVRSFSVFSRWGNLVFEENEKPVEAVEGWDGNVKGNPMPQGIYTYLLEAEAPDGKVEQFSGEVLLIR